MNNPFLSVILPTYNRKHCIERMIDSILMQDFKNYELIVVDDGSTDGTAEMLEEKYGNADIRIAYKENGGVSSARNLGISLARGEYITFVDSDDYLLDGFFRDIYETLQWCNSDILVYGGYVLKNIHQYEVPLFWFDREYGAGEIMINASQKFIRDFCLFGGNSWGCAKVFKTSLIQTNDILFNTGITYGEDLLFNIQAYFVASEIMTSPEKFYVYDSNTESLSRGILTIKEKLKNLLQVYRTLEEYREYKSYFSLSCLRTIRKWLPFIYVFLNQEEKKQIKMMYSEISLEGCDKFEALEFGLAKNYPICALPVSFLVFVIYGLYSRLSFIHPISSPIIKVVKKINMRKK